MRTILHFAQDSDTSGYFPQLARWHDRSRYRMIFGTLMPMAPWLRGYMESQGVECFCCECRGRPSYPRGLLRLAEFLRRRRVELLHTHLFDPSVVGLVAGSLARTPGRIMTRHYSDSIRGFTRPGMSAWTSSVPGSATGSSRSRSIRPTTWSRGRGFPPRRSGPS